MSETRHTPGPWVLADWDSDDREALIKMECTSPDEWHWAGWVRTRTIENARLICAAPLLLEACKEADRILWMAKEYAEAGGSGGPEMRDYTEAETAICAAIAAAEKGGEL